jgi:hypothetical protein
MAKVTGRINLKGYSRKVERAARREAAEAAADHILDIAQQLVPHETGVLQATGRVVVSAGGLRASVQFGTEYARRQHEELTWRHKPGRQAKYLEQPMMTEQRTCLAIMAKVLRSAA